MKKLILIIKKTFGTRKKRLMALGTLIVFLLGMVFSSFVLRKEAKADWYDDNWTYRVKVPVTSTNGSAQTDVYISFDSGSTYINTSDTTKFQTDCGDLRFTKENGQLLPYYIVSGCGTASTEVHVLFDTFPDGEMNVFYYYGNPTVANGGRPSDFDTEASNYTLGSFDSEETGPGPIGYWKFDEGADNTCPGGEDVCDSTASEDHGTFSGSPDWQNEDTCISGKCLYFDGTSDVVTVSGTSNTTSYNKSRTVSVWFRLNELDDQNGIIGTGDIPQENTPLWLLIQKADNKLSVYHGANYRDGQTTLEKNKWYHAVYTYDNSNNSANLYLNGKKEFSVTIADAVGAQDNANIYIGEGYDDKFNGNIDEVKIYPYARTEVEIKSDYSGGAAVLGLQDESWLSEGLVGYWKMDESSGTNVDDYSGNGNSGTLTNAQETGTAEVDDSTDTIVADDDNGNLATANDAYNGMMLRITGGGSCVPSVGEERTISDYAYDATPTRTITVSSAFSATTDDCTFEIRRQTVGKFGNSLDYDGIDDFVTIPYQDAYNVTEFTLAAWVKTTDSNRGDLIQRFDFTGGQFPGYALVMRSGYQGCTTAGTLGLWVGDLTNGYVCTTETVNDGEWHHAVATFDGSLGKVYIDGELSASGIRTPLWDTNRHVELGRDQFSSGRLDGKLDEARIYNRVLSPSEVQDLYKWAPGPVGYWKMDEASWTNDCSTDTVFDSSGNGNHGDSCPNGAGPTGSAIGKYGKAGEFDGNNDNVDCGNGSSLNFGTGNFSINAWIKTSSSGSRGGIATKYVSNDEDGYIFDIHTDNKIFFAFADQEASAGYDYRFRRSGRTVNDGNWHHVAGVRDGTDLHVYVDGILSEGTQTNVGNAQNSDSSVNLTIGLNIYQSDHYFDGKIDEVKIYNYVRSAEQIISDMNAGHPAPGSPVGSAISHWKFDQGYGDSAYDSSPQGNNGDLGGSGQTCPAQGTVPCPNWSNLGKFGKALDFDGTDDYLEVPASSHWDFGTSNFAISFWIKYPAAPNDDPIIATGDRLDVDEWLLFVEGTGMRLAADNDTWTINWEDANTEDDNWHHMVLVRDGADRNLYKDGVLLAPYATEGTFDASTSVDANSALRIMGGYTGSTLDQDPKYTDGLMDEVKIYNFALTADQVKIEYSQGKSAVFGATSTDTSGNPTWSADREYCPPGDTNSNCGAPVAEWKMDENTGTGSDAVKDTSGNENHGTMESSMTNANWVKGKEGNGLNFDGDDDYIDLGVDSINAVTNGAAAITISAWVKYDSLVVGAEENAFWSHLEANAYNASYMNIITPGYLVVGGRSQHADTYQTKTSSTLLSSGTWYHVVGILDFPNDEISLAINGQLEAATSVSFGSDTYNPGTPTCADTIGAYFNNSCALQNEFNGLIDNVRIYDYARTPAQIAWEYNRGGPVVWWKFDECSGDTVHDTSGNGYDGTIYAGDDSGSNDSVGTCSSGAGDEMWDNGTNGKRNASLDFDETNDYVQASTNPNLTGWTGLTVAAWVKPESGSWKTIVSKWQEGDQGFGSSVFELTMNGNNVPFKFALSTNPDWPNNLSTRAVPLGEWYHILGTWDGSTMYLYLDGKLESSMPVSGVLTNPETLTVGREAGNNFDFFNGQIDDVRLYNYGMTAQQVRDVYSSGGVRFGQ